MAIKFVHFLSRFAPINFRLNYTTNYNTFIFHHVASDPQHPICTRIRREYALRKKEGIWWHTTAGLELSKSAAVRVSCRRRLRHAFTEVLKQRGFDEYGRLRNADALSKDHKELAEFLRKNGGIEAFALTGSFRFHALVPCITSKYALLREEFSTLVDALLEEKCDVLLGRPQIQYRQSKTPMPITEGR